jgi:hypothetical protein
MAEGLLWQIPGLPAVRLPDEAHVGEWLLALHLGQRGPDPLRVFPFPLDGSRPHRELAHPRA